MGRYRLLEELGSGGFATVYRAEIVGTEGYTPKVAIKRIHPFLTHNSPNVISTLKNEARLAAMIEHPNVVHVYELGSEPDAEGQLQFYMVMELVEGRTLDVLRRMAAKRKEPLPAAVIVDLLLQVARGLAYVHSLTDDDGNALQMVHRDLKPGNVLVSTEGVAKIFDFGIAKAINSLGPRTATGVTRGTAAYMSPEQAYGKKVSFASDLFAFGAILFELTVGEQLIQADSMASQLMTVVNTPADYRADEVEQTVPGLGEIFVKLRQPAARDRHDSTQELIEALRVLRRNLEDETDPATYLANLLDDPQAQVTHEDFARQRVLGPGMRAPSTATFFELPGYRKDSTGRLVPAEEAAESWDRAQAATGSMEVVEDVAAKPSPRGRKLLLLPLLLLPLLIVAILAAGLTLHSYLRGGPEVPMATGASDAAEAPESPAAIMVPGDPATRDEATEPGPSDPAATAAVHLAEREGAADRTGDGPAAPATDDGRDEGDPDDGEAEAEESREREASADDAAAERNAAPGILKINAYPAATVYVDGNRMGSTFVTARGIELSPGRHHVKMVRSSDSKEQELSVKIEPGKTLAVPFEWEE